MTRTYADERARELLAAECAELGADATAHSLLRGAATDYFVATKAALRAIEKALALSTPQPDSDLVEKVASLSQANRDCIAKAKPGEPMFIILGRDPDGATIVKLWADRRAEAGDPDHAQGAWPIAEAMHEWAADPANAPETAPPASAYPALHCTLSTSPSGIEDAREAEEIERLRQCAKNNNTLARMNGAHRDQWRARAAELAEALEGAIASIRDAEKDTNFVSGDPYGESFADVLERVLFKPPPCESASSKIGGDHG